MQDFSPFIQGVEWNGHCPKLQRTEQGIDKFRDVREHDGDPVSFFYTQATETVGHTIGSAVQLLVCNVLPFKAKRH